MTDDEILAKKIICSTCEGRECEKCIRCSDFLEGLVKGIESANKRIRAEMKAQGLALQSDMDKTIKQNLALKKEVKRLAVKCEDYHEAMKDYATRFENYVKAFFE